MQTITKTNYATCSSSTRSIRTHAASQVKSTPSLPHSDHLFQPIPSPSSGGVCKAASNKKTDTHSHTQLLVQDNRVVGLGTTASNCSQALLTNFLNRNEQETWRDQVIIVSATNERMAQLVILGTSGAAAFYWPSSLFSIVSGKRQCIIQPPSHTSRRTQAWYWASEYKHDLLSWSTRDRAINSTSRSTGWVRNWWCCKTRKRFG